MDIKQALTIAAQRLANAERELAAGRKEVEALEARISGLRASHQFLEGLLAQSERDSPNGQPEIRSALDSTSWVALTRPDAVKRAMREAGTPVAPSDIAKRLKAAGRASDSPARISVVLDKLRKRGDVKSLGIGEWVLTGSSSENRKEEGGGEPWKQQGRPLTLAQVPDAPS
ncbi:MAG: hypothetical protein ACRDJ4_06380 [Actinomycetota bacterium]